MAVELTIGKLDIAPHNSPQMIKNIKSLRVNCYRKVAIASIIAGLLNSCASLIWGYGPDQQSRQEFEHRVEAAFRLQNAMTSEVMEIQSDGSSPEQHTPIIQAEQEMEKQCKYLNEYVSRDIDGKSKGFLLLKQVKNSVVDCESSAQKVKQLLKTHQR